MHKQAKNGKKWKKRFFILQDNYLFYWHSNKVYDLLDCTSILIARAALQDSDKNAKYIRLNGCVVEREAGKPLFTIVRQNSRRTALQLEDDRTADDWTSVLNEIIKPLPPPTTKEEISPQVRKQRYSTLQRLKMGLLSPKDKDMERRKSNASEDEQKKKIEVPVAATSAPPLVESSTAAAVPTTSKAAADSSSSSSSSS